MATDIELKDRMEWVDCQKQLATRWKGTAEFIEILARVRDKKLWRFKYKSWTEFVNRESEANGVTPGAFWKALQRGKETEAAQLIAAITGESTSESDGEPPKSTHAATVNPQRLIKDESQDKESSSPEKPAKIPRLFDATGFLIPRSLHPLWLRRNELQPYISAISRIKCELDDRRRQDDPLFSRLNEQVITDLMRIHHALSYTVPYAVCVLCQGRCVDLKNDCTACASSGLMTRHQYERVPTDKLKIRNMAIAEFKRKYATA